jgi:hypothetical protein
MHTAKKNVSVAVPSGYLVASLTLLLSILGKFFEMNNNIYCMHLSEKITGGPCGPPTQTG